MVGTGVPFTAFYVSVTNAVEHEPLAAYVVKLPTPMYSKKRLDSYCGGGEVFTHTVRVK